MGWQDAPPVESQGTPRWASAPAVEASPAEAAPGVLRRLLSPFKGMEPIIAANKAQADRNGPAPINRLLGIPEETEPDVFTGAKRLVRGIPGFDPTSTTTAADQRVARFNEEHPIMAPSLGMAGGLAQPAMLPMAGRVAAEAPAVAEAAAPAGAQAAAPVAQAAESAAPAAVNAYEAAGRGAKVRELVKAIEANAVTHLGVDPRAPQFAEALSGLPEQWWKGMAEFAKVKKPSQATIDDAIGFFRDRAAQTAKAAAEVPQAAAAAPAAVQAAVPAAAAPAAASQSGPLWAIVRKLQAMPKGEGLDMLDLLAGGAGLHHGGTLEGIATAVGSRLARNYGPPVAAAAMSKVAGAPGFAAGTAANMLRGAGGRDAGVSPERDAASGITQTVQPGEAAPDDSDQAPSALFWFLDPDGERSAQQLAQAKAIRGGAQKAPEAGSTSIRTGAGPVSYAAPNKPWKRRLGR